MSDYVVFTKRTDFPKLGYIIDQLNNLGIPNFVKGASFHAPLLWVPEDRLDEAWKILCKEINVRGKMICLDDVDDDDEMFGEVQDDSE